MKAVEIATLTEATTQPRFDCSLGRGRLAAQPPANGGKDQGRGRKSWLAMGLCRHAPDALPAGTPPGADRSAPQTASAMTDPAQARNPERPAADTGPTIRQMRRKAQSQAAPWSANASPVRA